MSLFFTHHRTRNCGSVHQGATLIPIHRQLAFLALALLGVLSPCLADSPSVRFDRQARTLSVSFPGASPAIWQGLTAGVKIDGQWRLLSTFESCDWLKTNAGSILRCSGPAPVGSFELEVDPSPNRNFMVLQARLRASSDCRLQGFRLLHPASDNSLLPPPGHAAGWTLYADGYNALEIGTLLPVDKATSPVQGAWISSLQNAGAERTLAFAALTGRLWPTWFEWNLSKTGAGRFALSIRAGGKNGGEFVHVRAATTVASDAVLVGYWTGRTPQSVLEEVADEIAGHNPRQTPPRRIMSGWCSWMYYPAVKEADVTLAAMSMEQTLKSAGYGMIQVDGGWWDKRGDWTPNERFPHGIAWLADEVHGRGLQFGLHMSPFRIDADSALAKEHPDWMLRKLDGTGLELEGTSKKERYILDASHPAALRWLGELFGRMARDWRVDYFKLDFLDLGTREGLHHDPAMTGLAAYRAAMRAIREAVPERVTILACNQPGLAGYEFADSVRIGPDINKVGKGHVGPNGEYTNMVWGPAEGVVAVRTPESPTLAAQARAVARQYYTHKRLFINDADAILVTPDYTLEEARGHATLVALTGGSLFLGDRLDTLPPERRALLTNPDVLAIWREGNHAVPMDLFSGNELPRIWTLRRPGGLIVSGIFNWTDEPQTNRFSLRELGVPEGHDYNLRDVWSSAGLELSGGTLVLRQPPHSVRLIEFRQRKQ